MHYVRAYISGIVFPTTILPVVLLLAIFFEKEELLTVVFLHIIPLFWGISNILYIAFFKDIFPGDEGTKLFLNGALLGVVLSLIGVFWVGLPEMLGLQGIAVYFPLVIVPAIYAVVWRYIVLPLNVIVGIKSH